MSETKAKAARRPCKDHLGNEYPSIGAMLDAYGITRAAWQKRYRINGWSLEKTLTTPLDARPGNPCKDHLGNEYPSEAAMLRAYGIPEISFRYRHKIKGWSLERTLTTPVQDSRLAGAMKCKDHEGNEFESKKAMCDYWHVPRALFFHRIRTGWSLERALTEPLHASHSTARRIFDPDGEEHRSIDAMCAKYGISKAQYMTNIRNNLPLAEALHARTEVAKRPKDHLGNEYPSTNAMCRAYGINKTVLRSRLELGWTLEQILTSPEKNLHYIKCTDHEGREFGNLKAMLEFHGISYTNYKHRRDKLKLNLEEALSKDNRHIKRCKDHRGNVFASKADMLAYWLVSGGGFHKRAQSESDVKYCLLGMWRDLDLPEDIEILKNIATGYYKIKYGDKSYIWNEATLYAHARRYKLEKYLASSSGRIEARDIAVKGARGPFYEISMEGRSILVTADALFRLAFLQEPFPAPNVVPNPVPDFVRPRSEARSASRERKEREIIEDGAKERRRRDGRKA